MRIGKASGWKTTLLTSVFFVQTSAFLAFSPHGTMLTALIRMFADVRWVGFLPPRQSPVKDERELYFSYMSTWLIIINICSTTKSTSILTKVEVTDTAKPPSLPHCGIHEGLKSF